ncbi:helix-turn-helix domain-containing protein [Halomonas sp. B23F22_10]|uniref:helix-turn-helix domain-containing protein n=1 Tax=Halomonas sp. B23F22_10 TaxID=3459515 RepID=UPI00373EB1F8
MFLPVVSPFIEGEPGLYDVGRSRARSPVSPLGSRLSMTRAEVGSDLDLALETIRRVLARFQQQGPIHVVGREIHRLDPKALVEVSERAERRAVDSIRVVGSVAIDGSTGRRVTSGQHALSGRLGQ